MSIAAPPISTTTFVFILLFLTWIANWANGAVYTVQDEEGFVDAMEAVQSGDTIRFTVAELRLTTTMNFTIPDIRLRSARRRTDIYCPEDGSALNVNTSMVAQRIGFRGCSFPAVYITSHADQDTDLEVEFEDCEFRNNRLRNNANSIRGAGVRIECQGNCAEKRVRINITRCEFRNNVADRGAGIYSLNSELRVLDSDFVNNTGHFGGSAIYSTQTYANSNNRTVVYINESRFDDNIATRVGLANDLRDSNGKPLEIVTYYTFTAPLATGGACLFENIYNTTIEYSNFSRNQAAAGGAISYLYDALKTPDDASPEYSINNCSFIENAATHENQFYERTREVRLGGALHIALNINDIEMKILGSNFTSNEAYHGGAIHLVASNAVEAIFEECRFEENYAHETGGAVILRYIGQLNWYSCNATENRARQGGAVMLTNQAGFHVRGLSVNFDETTNGVPSVFTGNEALEGGAIMCAGCGPVDIQHPLLDGNYARRLGGAVYVLECIHNFRLQHVTVVNNRALVGGALAAESSELFSVVTDGNLRGNITNNTAIMGGAVYYSADRQRTNTVFLRGEIFEGNRAVTLSNLNESLLETERRVLRLETSESLPDVGNERLHACGEGGGGAVCIGLTNAPIRSSFDVILEVSEFRENRAEVGGGVYISIDTANWDLQNTQTCSLTSSHLEACRGVTFRDVVVEDNVATMGGGGAFVSDPNYVECTCDKLNTTVASLKHVIDTLLDGTNLNVTTDLYCTDLRNNSVEEDNGEYGPQVATRAFSIELESPQRPFRGINSGDSNQTSRSGEPFVYVLYVKDAFSQNITGGRPEAQLEVSVESNLITGQSRYGGEGGKIIINATRVIAEDQGEMPDVNELHDLTFRSVRDRDLFVVTNFTFRECFRGEVWSPSTCSECPSSYFSFEPEDGNCIPCPEHATCTGGAVLTPEEGYWHATPFSPHFHKCLVHDACKYDNRDERLATYFADPASLELSEDVPDNDMYRQCSDGYKSRLCASCDDDYGRLSDGECISCDSRKAVTIVLIIFLTFWIGILVAIEIFNTLHTNHEFKELKAIRASRIFSSAMIPMGNCGPLPSQAVDPVQPASGPIYQDYGMTPGPSRADGEANIVVSDNIPPHIAASEKLTELIKILINFMQITSVAVSMNLQWQSAIKYILRFHEVLTGVTHGTSYLPLECTLEDSSVPGSIAVLWIRVSFPFIILVGFLMLGTIYSISVRFLYKRRNRGEARLPFGDLTTYCIVTIIAVSFFSYKDVTEELMRTLNCINIDTSEDDQDTENRLDHYDRFAVATDLYWGEDTSLECFEGDHLVTGIFGILGLAVFSFGTVLFNAVLLLKNFHAIGKERFIARYGFLYRSYRPLWYTVPWESVISIRKALVSAAVVYAFRLGRNLQAVMALGVLILAQAAHLICRPFKDYKTCPSLPEYAGHHSCLPFRGHYQRAWRKLNDKITLNYLESASLLTSMITFYSGIVFNDDQTSDAGIIVMTCFAATVNVGFFVYMIYRLYYAFHVMVNEMSSYVEETCEPESGFVYIKGPGIVALLKRTSRLIQYKYRQYMRKPGVDSERSALRVMRDG